VCVIRNVSGKIVVRLVADNEDEVPMVVPLDTKDDGVKKSGNICWGGSIEGIDCGDEVAAWLSWNVDRPGLRLVRCTGRNPPDVNNYGNRKTEQYIIISTSA